MNPLKKSLVVASVAISFAAGQATAAVMDFTGLPDFSNATYSQNGLDMTGNTVWNWPGSNMAHMDNGIATFKLATLGDFSLDSVFMDQSGGNGPARFTAFNNGSALGFVDLSGGAGVYNFGAPFGSIDEFQVSVLGDHFTFDNLNFSTGNSPGGSVPDGGSTLVLLGLAMSAVAGARRKFGV